MKLRKKLALFTIIPYSIFLQILQYELRPNQADGEVACEELLVKQYYHYPQEFFEYSPTHLQK